MFVKLFYKVTNLLNLESNNKEFNFKNRLFQEIKLLGEGGYGFVYLVKEVETNFFYAMKLMNFNEEDKHKIDQEIDIWNKLKHKNIVELLEYEYSTKSKSNNNNNTNTTNTNTINHQNSGFSEHFGTSTSKYCVKCLMPYSNEGSLLDFLNSRTNLNNDTNCNNPNNSNNLTNNKGLSESELIFILRQTCRRH